jgi:biopolymer transport protein ExbD
MRRRFARRAPRKPAELMLVPMIDIFTVLVTFLLMTAVFSRITIVELDLQSASSGVGAPAFRLEVIVRKQGIELTNGTTQIAAIPKVNGAYDLATLSELAMALKRDYPDTDDASVLLEPEIAYDHLIQVMDAIRSAEAPADPSLAGDEARPAQSRTRKASAAPPPRVALFTDIAVGDAP